MQWIYKTVLTPMFLIPLWEQLYLIRLAAAYIWSNEVPESSY